MHTITTLENKNVIITVAWDNNWQEYVINTTSKKGITSIEGSAHETEKQPAIDTANAILKQFA